MRPSRAAKDVLRRQDALDFGMLRSIAQRPPSARTWDALTGRILQAWSFSPRVVSEQWVPYLEGILTRWDDDLRRVPTSWLRVVRQGAEMPALRLTRVMVLEAMGLNAKWARDVFACPHIEGLRAVNLSFNPLGDRGVSALADATHLTRLETLYLWNVECGVLGARALAGSPVLAPLTRLNLGANGFGRSEREALAQAPYLSEALRAVYVEDF